MCLMWTILWTDCDTIIIREVKDVFKVEEANIINLIQQHLTFSYDDIVDFYRASSITTLKWRPQVKSKSDGT